MIRSHTWDPCPRGMVVPVVQEAPQSPHKVYRGGSYVHVFKLHCRTQNVIQAKSSRLNSCSSGTCKITGPPTFLARGTGFLEDSVSTNGQGSRKGREGLGWAERGVQGMVLGWFKCIISIMPC